MYVNISKAAATVSDTVKIELILVLPLSTHSAVENKMLHNSALYKFMIDIDIEIKFLETRRVAEYTTVMHKMLLRR